MFFIWYDDDEGNKQIIFTIANTICPGAPANVQLLLCVASVPAAFEVHSLMNLVGAGGENAPFLS